MKWDDPLPEYHEEENILARQIFGILSHYYPDRPEDSPVDVMRTYIEHTDMLFNQLLGINEPDFRLSENEIEEIIENLPESLMDAPLSIETIIYILNEMEYIAGRNFFHSQANEDPETAWEHVNVGNAKWELGKIEDAFRHYSEAISINPDFLTGYVARASCLEALGKIQEAMHDIKHIHEHKSNDIGDFYDYVSAADLAYQIGEFTYALDFVIKAIELILNDTHRAKRDKNCFVIQIGKARYSFYFVTISRLIKLIKDIEADCSSATYPQLTVAKKLIHDLREKIGI